MATDGGFNAGEASPSYAPKKKQRVGSSGSLSSTHATIVDGTLPEFSHKQSGLRRSSPYTIPGFNDPSCTDVILSLHSDHHSDGSSTPENTPAGDSVQIYLNSNVLRRRSKYFAALLSDRWLQLDGSSSPKDSGKVHKFSLSVPATSSIHNYVAVLKLLYCNDIYCLIGSVSAALNYIPIALELLFEDCVKACVKYIESVPWSEDEEHRILNVIPSLGCEETKDLLARVTPEKPDLSEEMFSELILSTTNNRTNMAFAKAFVAKLLRDFSSKASARNVLDKAFERTLTMVKVALEEYCSPNLRDAETEAIQRGNLQMAMANGKHLLWLVERMIERKVADTAVKAWSEQTSFTKDVLKMLGDDIWRNTAPSLPSVLLRCTSRITSALATGNILAARQVRMKLVTDWLPVLIMCKDKCSSSQKSLHLELEESFLKIISTLPMSDAQDLLQHCLSFSTGKVEDCSHLLAAFVTWFRRARRPMPPEF